MHPDRAGRMLKKQLRCSINSVPSSLVLVSHHSQSAQTETFPNPNPQLSF
jgi:hypothetical protein